MVTTKIIGLALAATLLSLATPAHAQNNGHTPPGNPCGTGPGQGTGNPCNGNNGNAGAQGNTGSPPSPPILIEMPPVSGRGAFVDQIGNRNTARITQSSPNAYARVVQDGDDNDVDVRQQGSAASYLTARQTGARNDLRVTQEGSGQNVLHAVQQGHDNILAARQAAGSGSFNGAILSQLGDRNSVALVQEGSDNRALLTQSGDDNAMTVAQFGDGNRLTWTQEGNGNSNLGITQSGSQTLLVTQQSPGR